MNNPIFQAGQSVKLNEHGIKHFFNDAEKDLSHYYTNREATILEVNFQKVRSWDYIIVFENEEDFAVLENEIVLAHTGENVEEQFKLEKQFGYFENMGLRIGEIVDRKQLAYGNSVDKTYRLMQIYLEKWKNEDSTYTIPESLLKHILLQVRLIDKQNRIFNNPDGDLMDENPYLDNVGYSMIGVRMMENN